MNAWLSEKSALRHFLLAAVLAAICAGAAAAEKLPDRIQVTWAPTEQLSEVKDNQINRGWMRPSEWMKTLGDHLRKRADQIPPPTPRPAVHTDDIKLVGAF